MSRRGVFLNHRVSHSIEAVQTDSSSLPKYANPPVVEVAISVQFDELTLFQPVHFGLLWEQFRSKYPRTAYHPPLGTIVELFGTSKSQSFALNFESKFPVGRCWYLSEDEHRLIQVQPDRFIVNWRKLDTESSYPSYDNLREQFRAELDSFLAFVADNELGTFEPRQCEVTYVNHILSGSERISKGELSEVLSLWSAADGEGQLPSPEDLQFSWRYGLQSQGRTFGSLHVSFNSAIRTVDKHPLIVLQMIGRGRPAKGDTQGVMDAADALHAWIVTGFTEITTSKMHDQWGRLR